jgi:hypothetical protein
VSERSEAAEAGAPDAVLGELERRLDDDWDPPRPLRDWPVEWFGKGLTAADSMATAPAICHGR